MLSKRLVYDKQLVESAALYFSVFSFSNINMSFVENIMKKTTIY